MDRFIKNIQSAIDAFSATNFLVPDSYKKNQLSKACILYLEQNNYFVNKKPEITKGITNTAQLILWHYNLLIHKFGNSIQPNRNKVRDMVTAKQFISHIKESMCVGYEQALVICANIIKVVIHRYDEVGLHDRSMLSSFSIYGQNKLGWVTQKALNIINNDVEREQAELIKSDKMAEEYLKEHENLDLGFPDLEELAK